MKLTEHHRSRLYALTALACAVWLVQSLMESHNDGSLFTWPTIIFSLCLLIVIAYTLISAIRTWNVADRSDDAASTAAASAQQTENTPVSRGDGAPAGHRR